MAESDLVIGSADRIGQGTPRVSLQLLGTPRLLRSDGTAVELERKHAAFLLLTAWSRHVSRERIWSMMWPGAPVSQAQTNLRVVKHRLARLAGCPILDAGAMVRLACGTTCDIAAIKGRPASSLGPHEVALLLEQPLLGQFEYPELEEFSDLLRRERELLRDLALDAALQQAEELARDAAHPEAALSLLGVIGLERPADERVCRLSMRLLMARNDRAGALVAFERCREALSTLLGVGPSPATVSLHRSILMTRDEDQERLPLGEISTAAVDVPPFVEREALLPRIWLALRQGRVVWITGAAGLGKTRLLHEALRARSRAVHVSCRPTDPAQPYSSLTRLVAALHRIDGLGRKVVQGATGQAQGSLQSRLGLTGKLDAARVLSAVEALMRQVGGNGVSVVAVDDLHFMDRASAEALQGWCERLNEAQEDADAPSLPGLVLASRADEHGPEVAQLRLLLEGRDGLERVELHPLSVDALRTMLSAMELPWLSGPDAADTLRARSGGNPYIAIEIIRESRWAAHPERLAASPVSVLEMLGSRIERLDRPAQDLALLAAVAGTQYSSTLADELLDLTPMEHVRAWRSLERAGIFDDRGLAHDLALAAVQHHLSAAGLELLHSRIADFLLRHGAEPGVVARRLVAAGRRPEAFPHALEAAHHLVDVLGLYEEAVELLDHVLGEGLPRGPHAFELCELRCQLEHWSSDSVPAAVGYLQELAEAADERERAAVARARCLTWVLAQADAASSQQTVRELLAAVPAGSPHRLVLLACLVMVVRTKGDVAWARELAAELAAAVLAAPAHVDALPMADLQRVSTGLLGGDQAAAEAREMQRQAARLRAADRLVDLYHLQRIVQYSMFHAGDLAGWSRATAELDELHLRVGPRHLPDQRQILGGGPMWVAAGELETARALLDKQDASALDAFGQWTLRLGRLLLWQSLGQEERFDSIRARPLDAGPPALSRGFGAWEAAIVAAEMLHRGVDDRTWIEAGRQAMAGQGSHVAMTLDLLHAGSLEPESGMALAQHVLQAALEAGRLGMAAAARVEVAALAYKLGRLEHAREHALEAARSLQRYGNFVIWRGHSLRMLAAVLDVCDPAVAVDFRARYESWKDSVAARLPAGFVVDFRKRWTW